MSLVTEFDYAIAQEEATKRNCGVGYIIKDKAPYNVYMDQADDLPYAWNCNEMLKASG